MSRNRDDNDIDIFQEQLEESLSEGVEEIYAHHIEGGEDDPIEGEVIIDEDQVEDSIRHTVNHTKERADARKARQRKKKKVMAAALIGVGGAAMIWIMALPDSTSNQVPPPPPIVQTPVKPVIPSQYASQHNQPNQVSVPSREEGSPVSVPVEHKPTQEKTNKPAASASKPDVPAQPSHSVAKVSGGSMDTNDNMRPEVLEKLIEERLNAKLDELQKAHQSQVSQLETEIARLKESLAEAKRKMEKEKKKKPRFLGYAPTAVKVLQDGLLLRRASDGELVVGAIGERLKVYGTLLRVYPEKNMFLTDRGLWRVKP